MRRYPFNPIDCEYESTESVTLPFLPTYPDIPSVSDTQLFDPSPLCCTLNSTPDPGSSILEPGSRILDPRSRVRYPGSRISCILDTGSWIRDPAPWLLDFTYPTIQDPESWKPFLSTYPNIPSVSDTQLLYHSDFILYPNSTPDEVVFQILILNYARLLDKLSLNNYAELFTSDFTIFSYREQYYLNNKSSGVISKQLHLYI